MAAHFPLAPNRSRTVFGSSRGRFSADQVANVGSRPLPARTVLGTDGRRGKSAGRPEGGFVHERQFPRLVAGRGAARVAVRVVDAEVPGRRCPGRGGTPQSAVPQIFSITSPFGGFGRQSL